MKPDLTGKHVALVGNASAGLYRHHGENIDAHDVVIRMNAGVPEEKHYSALGQWTDILAVGTLECLHANDWSTAPVWFWKATKLGDKQWETLKRNVEFFPDVWRVPKDWVHDAQEAVGAKPSGGIVLVHALVHHLGPASISVFNFDFFGALGSKDSWWHTERPEAVIHSRHRHDGERELEVFKEIGFTQKEVGWWTWKRAMSD